MKIRNDLYAIELWNENLFYLRGATEFPQAISEPVLVNNIFSAYHFSSVDAAHTMCSIIKKSTGKDFRTIIVPFYAVKNS